MRQCTHQVMNSRQSRRVLSRMLLWLRIFLILGFSIHSSHSCQLWIAREAAKLNTTDHVLEVDSLESITLNCSSPCGRVHWTFNQQTNYSGLAIIEEEHTQHCVNDACNNLHILLCSKASPEQTIQHSLKLRPIKSFVLQCIAQLDFDRLIYPFYSPAVKVNVKQVLPSRDEIQANCTKLPNSMNEVSTTVSLSNLQNNDTAICNILQAVIITGSTLLVMVLIAIIILTTVAVICFQRNKLKTSNSSASDVVQTRPVSTVSRNWEDDVIGSITTTTFGKSSDYIQHRARDSAYQSDSNDSSQNDTIDSSQNDSVDSSQNC